MAEFTQQQLTDLAVKARSVIKDEGDFQTKFIGVKDGLAVFGFRLRHAKGVKVGLPVFVAVDHNGECIKITDRNTRFDLMAQMGN